MSQKKPHVTAGAPIRATSDFVVVLEPDRQLEAELREALARHTLELLYQPQVSAAGGRLVGVEAQLHWAHPVLGPLGAERLIPLAEQAGLLGEIGHWALRRACLTARKWQRQGLPAVRTTIDVSGAQLRQGDFAERLACLLAETGLEPRRLGIELAEPVLLPALDTAVAQLRRLHELGVQIALDHFGTGWSSLSCLRRLPLDLVKIDRALAPGASGHADALPTVRAIVAMSRSLGLQVLAEGVTDEAQLALLAASRCDLLQGPHVGAAVPAGAIEALLRGEQPLPALQRRRTAAACNVLLVDDEPRLLELACQRLVERYGDAVNLSACVDPRQALQSLRDTAFDLVACDLRMPGLDGLALLQQARRIQPDAVRMMLLGPADLVRVMEDARQVDVFRYLPKPWTAEQFNAHFDAALEQVAQQRGAGAPAAVADGPDADEWVLPTQLPTMPGDLWAPRAAAEARTLRPFSSLPA